ncbi:MAG TPA: hypothetical protein VNQ77_11665 [Frankiaceae bacterium]|nr:hypothetical protein [Frankiaceae bacterium]
MRKLSLKTERLTELTTAELQMAVGGTFTGKVDCILSLPGDKCVSVAPCTRDLVPATVLCQ